MTAPSDPVDLAEVRALLAGATPGPWYVDRPGNGAHLFVGNRGDGRTSGLWDIVYMHGDDLNELTDDAVRDAVADAALIAAAPTLLAALADEVERLRGEVARAREVLTYISSPTTIETPSWDFGRCISAAQGFFEKYPKTGALDPPAQVDTEEGGR